MATINHVKKARKAQGICGHCGKPIEVGTSYMWVQVNRFSSRMARHLGCPTWRPSELESNEKRSTFLGHVETAEDAVADASNVEELRDALQTLADGIREVAEMYRESAQNIEDGFGHETEKSQEMNERADEVDGWADDLESEKDNLEDDPEWIVYDGDDVELSRHEALEEAEEARDAVREAMNGGTGPGDMDELAYIECSVEDYDFDNLREQAQDAINNANQI